jgi:hypothetical protein
LVLLAAALSVFPAPPAAAAVKAPPFAARLFGCVLSWDAAEGRAVMYGTHYAREGSEFEAVATRQIVAVRPRGPSAASALASNVGRWAAVEGVYGAASGLPEKALEAWAVKPSDYATRPPEWRGFGLALRTELAVAAGLEKPGSLAEVLAAMARLFGAPEDRFLSAGEAQKAADAVLADAKKAREAKDFRRKAFPETWLAPKDGAAKGALRRAAADSLFVFAEGVRGGAGAWAAWVRDESALWELCRKGGGGSPRGEGEALAIGRINVVRDESGEPVEARLSGLFFMDASELFAALKDPPELPPGETWRLADSGLEWADERDGKIALVSGTKIVVRDEKGEEIDRYFAAADGLTAEGAKNAVAVARRLWRLP